MKVSFVILHYLSFDDTIECVDSIIDNVKYDDKNIVVVDNASPNDSFEKLKNHFRKHKYHDIVHLIKNEDNLGFAKGNNVGFSFCKYSLKSDFIILINNDTFLKQSDFVYKLIEKWDKSRFYVLGPDVIAHDGYHQNPMGSKKWTVFKLYLFLFKNIIRLIDAYVLSILDIFVKIKRSTYLNDYNSGDLENVKLHGSCLIFSPAFVERFDGLFDKTFLYMEEDILFTQMNSLGLKTLYSSDLYIFHKEDAATDLAMKTTRKKKIFFLKNLIKSNIIFLKYFKDINKSKKNI